MKHTKLLTFAIAALFAGTSMAETETNPTSNISSSVDLVGTSYTLKGDYVAGLGGAKAGTMTSKGVKFRINKTYGETANAVPFLVNEGYKITNISFNGHVNDNTKTSVISKVLVDGTELSSFTAVTLPAKTTSLEFSTGDIEAKTSVVLVFDGAASQANIEYTITYEVAQVPTNIATLSSISVDGEPLADFAPDKLTYTVELSYGTTTVPTVTVTCTSKKATPAITPATAVPGATTIRVTAEDGQTYKDYTVNFTVAAAASSEKELLNVKIGGQAVAIENNAGSLLVSKNADLTQQTITFEVSESATASITSGSTQDFTNPLTITVTAQDQSTATYTITLTKAAKDVLYLTTASVEGDKLYKAVAATGYYVEVRANNANTEFSAYDLVVLHESLDGKASINDGELKAIATADVPVLNTKSFFYTYNEDATKCRWGWGTPINGQGQQGVKLNTAKYSNIASHPLFAGFTGDSITLYSQASEKTIQPIQSFTAGKEGYALANVSDGVAIHELPAADRVGDGGTSKYLLISLSNAAWSNLSDDASTLFSNAINYLLGTEAWAPQVIPSAIDAVSADTQAVKRIVNGQLVIEKNGQRYNAQGIVIE